MIRIRNTKKTDVLTTLSVEINFLVGLRDNLQELRNLPASVQADIGEAFKRNGIIAGIEKKVRKEVPGQADFLETLSYSLTGLTIWLGMIESTLKGSKAQVYDSETMTFKDRGLLDAISAVNFFNRYTDMLLDVITTYAYSQDPINKILSKVDLAFFSETADYYGTLVVRFNQSPKALNEMIEQLSEEIADEVSEEILKGAEGEASVSIRSGLAPHQLNPVFWWQLWAMRRDVESIRNGENQIKVLAMKIARLNNKASGTEDPNLDHAIETYSNEIIKIKARNRAIVEKYNG